MGRKVGSAAVMTIISFSVFEELKSNVTSFVIVISVTKPTEESWEPIFSPLQSSGRRPNGFLGLS